MHVHAIQVGGGLSIASRALEAVDLVDEGLNVQLVIGPDRGQVLGEVHAGSINDASVWDASGRVPTGAGDLRSVQVNDAIATGALQDSSEFYRSSASSRFIQECCRAKHLMAMSMFETGRWAAGEIQQHQESLRNERSFALPPRITLEAQIFHDFCCCMQWGAQVKSNIDTIQCPRTEIRCACIIVASS